MNARHARFAVFLAILAMAGCHDFTEPAPTDAAGIAKASAAEDENGGNVQTIDHRVAHVSTVPANQCTPNSAMTSVSFGWRSKTPLNTMPFIMSITA